jgi:glycosyltransferase involved in cell wall biosynthesis
LIGDKYEDDEEFIRLATSIVPSEKMYYENLQIAKERDKYVGEEDDNKLKLWCSGGVNARNEGISRSLSQGFSYICHLDHDDMWERDHLEVVSSKADEGYFFVATKSMYLGQFYLPPWIPEDIDSYIPEPFKLSHSSYCMDYSSCDLRYIDVFEVEGTILAADAKHFTRIGQFMMEHNLKGYLVNKVTCHHDLEHNPLDSLRAFM